MRLSCYGPKSSKKKKNRPFCTRNELFLELNLHRGLDLDTLVDVTWVGHVGSHAGGGAVGAVEDGRRVELLERGLVPKYRCRYVSTGCDNYCLRQDSYQHRSTALLVLVSAWSYSTMTVVDTPPLFNTRDWYKDTSRHIAD